MFEPIFYGHKCVCFLFMVSSCGGDWKGRFLFKMYFNSGGAIDFAMEFLRLIRTGETGYA